jgi:hypothetical protein
LICIPLEHLRWQSRDRRTDQVYHPSLHELTTQSDGTAFASTREAKVWRVKNIAPPEQSFELGLFFNGSVLVAFCACVDAMLTLPPRICLISLYFSLSVLLRVAVMKL